MRPTSEVLKTTPESGKGRVARKYGARVVRLTPRSSQEADMRLMKDRSQNVRPAATNLSKSFRIDRSRAHVGRNSPLWGNVCPSSVEVAPKCVEVQPRQAELEPKLAQIGEMRAKGGRAPPKMARCGPNLEPRRAKFVTSRYIIGRILRVGSNPPSWAKIGQNSAEITQSECVGEILPRSDQKALTTRQVSGSKSVKFGQIQGDFDRSRSGDMINRRMVWKAQLWEHLGGRVEKEDAPPPSPTGQ